MAVAIYEQGSGVENEQKKDNRDAGEIERWEMSFSLLWAGNKAQVSEH